MRWRLVLLAAAVVLGPVPAARAHGATVAIFHDRLEPAEVEIPVGGTVHFTNAVAMPGGHSVAADDGSFRSPPLDKGEGWHHTFDEPGRYPYHIAQHLDVKGVVVVGPE